MKNLLAITAITSGAPRAPLVLRGDLVKAVGQAADWGYDAIEIHIIDAGDFPLPLMKDACSRYGVKVSAIVTLSLIHISCGTGFGPSCASTHFGSFKIYEIIRFPPRRWDG